MHRVIAEATEELVFRTKLPWGMIDEISDYIPK